MTITNGMVTSTVQTAGSQYKRDFSEVYRRLYSNQTKILALIKGSTLDAKGKPSFTGNGMISKQSVTRMDPEWAIITPIDILYACTGGSVTTAVIGDTSGFQAGDKIVNNSTWEVAIVSAVTDTTTLTVVAVGTWSCAAGQYIQMMSSTFEEGTSRYTAITKEPSVIKTYLEITREALSMAETAMRAPEYTTEKAQARNKTEMMLRTLTKIERSFIFSKHSATGTTSVTINNVKYPLYSMRGILDYAGEGTSLGGAFSWDTWDTVMYPLMPDILSDSETVYAFMSKKLAGVMNRWATQSYLTMGANASGVKFGKKIKTYLMGGHLEVEPIVHQAFNAGGLEDTMVLFPSSDLQYLFMKGLDLQVKENVQLPSTMGKDDIFQGVVGLKSWSNGAAIKVFTNCLNAG